MEREIEVQALLPLELDGSVAGPLSFFLAAASGPLPPSCSFHLVPGDVSSSLSRYIASKAASRSFVSFSTVCCLCKSANSQSLMHERTSTMSGVSRRRRSSRTLLAKLKVDSEEIVDTGTVKTSLASIDKIG